MIARNAYDPSTGNVLTSGLPIIGAFTTYGYDAIGNVTSITDPRQYTTEHSYDNNRRKRITKNHNGDINAAVIAAQRTSINSVGQVYKEEAGTAFSGTDVTAWQTLQDITYTHTGKVHTRANGAGNTVTHTYDPMDRILEIDDPDHRKTRFQYDLAGQLLKETRAWGTALQQDYATYSYTPNGKRASINDAKNNRTEFRYDRFDRLRYVKYPVAAVGANQVNENDFEQYEYDNNGNRTLKITRDGKGIVSFFDNLNREIARNFPDNNGDGNLLFKYDLAGRPLWRRFSSTNTGIDYHYDDPAKRLSREVSFGLTIALGYDVAGNRSYVQWPDGHYISYSYDALNRMTEVRENQMTPGVGVLQTYQWDPLSRRSSTTPMTRMNGTSTSFAYDAASRLTGLGHDVSGTAQDFTLGFAYTAASQLATRSTTNDTIGWWAAPELVQNYAPVDGLNRYTSVNNVTFTHDSKGNLTSDGTRTFTYDAENRLTNVAGGSAPLSLSYDPLGRISQVTSSSDVTRFLYDGDRLVAEYNAAGTTVRHRYAHGAGVDEPIVWYEGSGMGTKHWLHSDERGSIVATTNASGVATPYLYGPYGEQSNWTGSRFRYTGQIMLPQARLYHYKARVYDPSIGRFLQTDPIGYEDDFNLYAYVGNDPLNKFDPAGTESVQMTNWSLCSLQGGSDCGTSSHQYSGEGFVSQFPGTASVQEWNKGNYKFAAGLLVLDVGTLGRGSALRQAMTRAGTVFRKGDVAHHIVAQGLKDKFSIASRALLDKFEIHIDDAVNGAKVKDWYHQTSNFLHDEKYTKMVYDGLSSAAKNGAEAVRNELKSIGAAIENAAKATKETKVCQTGSRICR